MRFQLRKSLFLVPNLITLSSVFCGFYASIIVAEANNSDDFYRSTVFIVLAMFLDTLDGRVARLTRTQSSLGVQLDSLADVISFGLAPSLLVYRWSLHQLAGLGVFVSFCFLAAGVLRLARFNVLAVSPVGAPNKPKAYTLGLPIPAAAGILVSLVAANHALDLPFPGSPVFVMVLVLALSFFMVSTLRFRSFKDLKLNAQSVALVLFAIIPGILLALRYHISVTLIWLLGAYMALGVGESFLRLLSRLLDAKSKNKEYNDHPSTP
ncbi:MAG: CDP-diacylglycerol--serine O-phosphatidyltransferase [Myxococcales bacterium]|nr:MAG: CDP-diacylglycerol--serine O-phosphatidyltransferase [Myxococcales bacterium]